jgi:hypothetical protein
MVKVRLTSTQAMKAVAGRVGMRRCTGELIRAGTWGEERSGRSAEGKKKRRSKQVNDLD